MTVKIKGHMIQQKTTISKRFSLAIGLGHDNHTAFLTFCAYNGSTIPQQNFGEGTQFVYASGKHWPLGEYCIYSMGSMYYKNGKYHWDHGQCPQGLTPGYSTYPFATEIKKNSRISPFSVTKVHINHTKIQYCCSTHGNRNKSIDLPLAIPFYLFPYGNNVCQKVQNMDVRLEYISWPSMEVLEDGTHPYTEGGSKVYYCYYIPKGSGQERSIRAATYGVMFGIPLLTVGVALVFRFRRRWQLRKFRHRRMYAATVDDSTAKVCTATTAPSANRSLFTSLPS
ncbi:uncharacterized protein [Amphiura filiformis]|uniref:uncharacterized protein n=1 Tax=Amphiura filiformis TaxID=82378 RepID=UPI003B215ECC